jgi:hypothetical protein
LLVLIAFPQQPLHEHAERFAVLRKMWKLRIELRHLREWTPVKESRYVPVISLFSDSSCCSAVVLVTRRPLQLR